MVNTITKQTLLDGERNLKVKITIEGDGSGDESDTNLIDVSSYNTNSFGQACSEVRLDCITGYLLGFNLSVLWDATANTILMAAENGEFGYNYKKSGGLIKSITSCIVKFGISQQSAKICSL